jgi:hypothetical protein
MWPTFWWRYTNIYLLHYVYFWTNFPTSINKYVSVLSKISILSHCKLTPNKLFCPISHKTELFVSKFFWKLTGRYIPDDTMSSQEPFWKPPFLISESYCFPYVPHMYGPMGLTYLPENESFHFASIVPGKGSLVGHRTTQTIASVSERTLRWAYFSDQNRTSIEVLSDERNSRRCCATQWRRINEGPISVSWSYLIRDGDTVLVEMVIYRNITITILDIIHRPVL